MIWVGGCKSTNLLCMCVWTIYLQCRKRWRLLLRNVNFLLDHKRTHNMKGLIRNHVYFNTCRTQVAALYTASSLHYVRFFPHTLCTKQYGLDKHHLQFVTSCALHQPPPYGTLSTFDITLQATSNPHYMFRFPNISTGRNPEQPVIHYILITTLLH